VSAVREDILRVKGELKQVHEHRTAAVDLRLPAYASAAEDLYGKLALSRFALHKPEMYFHRPTASAVLSTLNAYASEDFPRLTGILKDCRPKLDAAFDHLVAVNKEDDDGQWPRDEVDRLRLIDTRFLFRHLRLIEYVLDFFALPLVAFHCERRGIKWRDLGTKNSLEDHLPKTPAAILAKHWSAVVRNAIAHGGVAHLPSELEFRDNRGQLESRGQYEFVHDTDRLLDACNGAALAYTAFFLHLAAQGGHEGVPLGVARAVLHGFVDRPSCSVQHVTVVMRGGGPQLHVYLRHRLPGAVNLMHEAYRTALVGLDLMPQVDLFGIQMTSEATGLSFFYFERTHLAPYATGEISLEELIRRVSEKPMQYWDTSLPMRRVGSRVCHLFEVVRAGWPGVLHQLRQQARARGKIPVDIIDVRDISADGKKWRKAAVSIDALPGQSASFSLRTFKRIAEAVNRAKVQVRSKRHRRARRWGMADYLQVQVYSHEVRPRTPEGNQFADPYLFTLEYARRGDFLLTQLWKHKMEAVGRFRYWLPEKFPESQPPPAGGPAAPGRG